jgi:hypothetical protein
LRSEIEPDSTAAPAGIRFARRMATVNDAERRVNLACFAGGKVKLLCSHDLAEFAAMRSEERQDRPQAPVSAARRSQQDEVRARGR